MATVEGLRPAAKIARPPTQQITVPAGRIPGCPALTAMGRTRLSRPAPVAVIAAEDRGSIKRTLTHPGRMGSMWHGWRIEKATKANDRRESYDQWRRDALGTRERAAMEQQRRRL